jgi:inhibitor of cysteine peptidase
LFFSKKIICVKEQRSIIGAEHNLAPPSSSRASRNTNKEINTMTLTELDSGLTVHSGLSSVIAVHLNENPTTGYRWTVENASGLEQIGDSFNAGGMIGAAGKREFLFRPNKTGMYEICIKHWRDWQGEGSVIGRFAVRIVIK